MRNAHGLEVPGSAGSSRPVDGEQQQKMSRPKNSYSQKNHAGNGNGSERLSQSHVLHKTRSTDYDPALEKELDRRSSDWTFKLEKYQSEEQKSFRERVRELAVQNVSLQREVSSFHEREAESRKLVTYSELQMKDLIARAKEAMEEDQSLQKNLSELQEKYRAAEEDRDCFKRNYEEKDEDNKELHKSITRLLIRCSEQEKTIDGLRKGLSEAIGKSDRRIGKLQSEQMRLTGVEQALRRELESYRREIYTPRRENINCLRTDFEESTKQLTIMKGILPKVYGDRDMLGERVKQCSEEKMLLSAEVSILKKKIEAIEEDLFFDICI